MHRYFVTGTDTDVGKTRVTAALAMALREREPVTLVKVVQTGVNDSEQGDAVRAGRLAGVTFGELARFEKPADPWSAAVAAGAAPLCAATLARELDSFPGALVAEGAGGLMVPLNEAEYVGDVAVRAHLDVVLVVGLRLGCINHALLTHAACQHWGLRIAGAVLVERYGTTDAGYARDVTRALQGKLDILGIVPFAVDEAASVRAAARLFADIAR